METSLPFNLRPTTHEYVHSVMRAHFRSRDADGVTPLDSPRSCPKTPWCTQTSYLFYRNGIIAERSFTLQEWRFWTTFAPVTLTLSRWPSYTNLTRIPWRYTGCANINLLPQGFRKFSSDRQTNRQTERHDRNYIPRRFAGGQKSRQTSKLEENLDTVREMNWKIRLSSYKNLWS